MDKYTAANILNPKTGGKARREKYSPEELSEQSRRAAAKRYGHDKLPKATHTGKLIIGNTVLECAVLDNKTRIITQNSMQKALGRQKLGGKTSREAREMALRGEIPRFLAANNLLPLIPNDLKQGGGLIKYVTPSGKATEGFSASLIPDICDVYLKAREMGVLSKNQEHIAQHAEIIVRGLAAVGITALVDEATGFQEERARNELQIILQKYIAEEMMPWTMRFPHSFFKAVLKLYGYKYEPGQKKRPQFLGQFINRHIYGRMPEGVLEELKNRNPTNDQGNRCHRHHQFLTESVGQDQLNKQIASVITLCKIAKDKDHFEDLAIQAFDCDLDE